MSLGDVAFDGEVMTVKVTLSIPGSATARLSTSVVVERLKDHEMTMAGLDAQDEAVRRAAMDQLRPFLNNSTYVDLYVERDGVPLSDVPVVKRAST